MKKRLVAVLLCLCLAIGIMPLTAFAENYPDGWDPSKTYSEDDTITIDGANYDYGDDVSAKALDLDSPPDVKTIYKAGTGTILWNPTVGGDPSNVIGGTLTFNNATMTLQNSDTITLPGLTNGINVELKGTNSITNISDAEAKAFVCRGTTTFNLTAGSNTTLNVIIGNHCYEAGIRFSSPKSLDTFEITGSGDLSMNTSSTGFYSIDASVYMDNSVTLSGGTLNFNSHVRSGNVTLGGVTIPDGAILDLSQASSVTKGTTGAIVEGTLMLPGGTTIDELNALGLVCSGIVNIDSSDYIYLDGEWVNFGNDDFTDGLDISSAPTVKTAYKAGTGTVVWTPTVGGDPSTVISGTLTFNNAQIEIDHAVGLGIFTLPDVPVTVELKGTNTISNTSATSLFKSENSVKFTGSGSLNSTSSEYFIDTSGAVTLNTFYEGKIKANAITLNNFTIPDGKTLNLSKATGQVTATNLINNGLLVLKRAADTNADIAAVKALKLIGSGIVKTVDGTANYYENDGTVIPTIGGSMNFRVAPSEGNWSNLATVKENGYEFSGNSADGYTLKLGNLVIDTYDLTPCIILPSDGSVKVILSDGTTTRLNSNSSGNVMDISKEENEYLCTITGNGRLIMDCSAFTCLYASQPLCISGGDIIIKGFSAYGIRSENDITINGGSLKITAKQSAIKANSLTLDGMEISSPADASFNGVKGYICDAQGNAVKNMTVSKIVPPPAVPSASVLPNPVSYDIARGADNEWTNTDNGNLSFTVNSDYSKFTNVFVDGVLISRDNYTSKSGSTIITLKASYLKTLPAGKHEVRINFTDGYAQTSFTVNNVTNTDNPNTGITTNIFFWITLLINSGGVVAIVGITKKRKKKND